MKYPKVKVTLKIKMIAQLVEHNITLTYTLFLYLLIRMDKYRTTIEKKKYLFISRSNRNHFQCCCSPSLLKFCTQMGKNPYFVTKYDRLVTDKRKWGKILSSWLG